MKNFSVNSTNLAGDTAKDHAKKTLSKVFLQHILSDSSVKSLIHQIHSNGLNQFRRIKNIGNTIYKDSLPYVHTSVYLTDKEKIHEKFKELTGYDITEVEILEEGNGKFTDYDVWVNLLERDKLYFKYWLIQELQTLYNYNNDTHVFVKQGVAYKVDWGLTGNPIGTDFNATDKLANTDYNEKIEDYRSKIFVVYNKYTSQRLRFSRRTKIEISSITSTLDNKKTITSEIMTSEDELGNKTETETILSVVEEEIPTGTESESDTTVFVSESFTENIGEQTAEFLTEITSGDSNYPHIPPYTHYSYWFNDGETNIRGYAYNLVLYYIIYNNNNNNNNNNIFIISTRDNVVSNYNSINNKKEDNTIDTTHPLSVYAIPHIIHNRNKINEDKNTKFLQAIGLDIEDLYDGIYNYGDFTDEIRVQYLEELFHYLEDYAPIGTTITLPNESASIEDKLDIYKTNIAKIVYSLSDTDASTILNAYYKYQQEVVSQQGTLQVLIDNILRIQVYEIVGSSEAGDTEVFSDYNYNALINTNNQCIIELDNRINENFYKNYYEELKSIVEEFNTYLITTYPPTKDTIDTYKSRLDKTYKERISNKEVSNDIIEYIDREKNKPMNGNIYPSDKLILQRVYKYIKDKTAVRGELQEYLREVFFFTGLDLKAAASIYEGTKETQKCVSAVSKYLYRFIEDIIQSLGHAAADNPRIEIVINNNVFNSRFELYVSSSKLIHEAKYPINTYKHTLLRESGKGEASFLLERQIDGSLCETYEVRISNIFTYFDNIAGNGSGSCNTVLFPLFYNKLSSLSSIEYVDIISYSLNLISYYLQEVDKPWYATSIFQAMFTWAMVLITVISVGTLSPVTIAGMSTTAKLLIAASLMLSVTLPALTKIITNSNLPSWLKIAIEAGIAIASTAVSAYSAGFSLTNIISTSTSIVSTVNKAFIDIKTIDLDSKMQELQSKAENEHSNLQELLEEYTTAVSTEELNNMLRVVRKYYYQDNYYDFIFDSDFFYKLSYDIAYDYDLYFK